MDSHCGGGAELAVDTTLVSPLTSSSQPRRRAGQYAGAALQDARKSKERTYPELLRSRRCRLVVLAIETGGRWSPEATTFLRLLAHAKARAVPNILRKAVEASLLSRWSAILTHAAQHAFAASLLDLDCAGTSSSDGDTPSISQLLSEAPPPPPARNRDITPNHPPTGYLSAICDGAHIFVSISARHTPEQQSVSQAWTPYGARALHFTYVACSLAAKV